MSRVLALALAALLAARASPARADDAAEFMDALLRRMGSAPASSWSARRSGLQFQCELTAIRAARS